MAGATSLIDIFIVVLAVAGGLILVNGLIDLGLGSIFRKVELRLPRSADLRAASRQKTKTASLPPR